MSFAAELKFVGGHQVRLYTQQSLVTPLPAGIMSSRPRRNGSTAICIMPRRSASRVRHGIPALGQARMRHYVYLAVT